MVNLGAIDKEKEGQNVEAERGGETKKKEEGAYERVDEKEN